MKKKVIITALVSLLLVLSFSLGVFASSKITLIVNGEKANVAPLSIDGVTYIPLRSAAELLGAEVGWDGTTSTVSLNSSGGNTVKKESAETENVVYGSCKDVKAAGKAPIKKGEPGYSTKLDRDGDGIACE